MAIIAEMLTGKQAFELELETLNYIVIVFFFSFKYNFKYFKHILNYLEVWSGQFKKKFRLGKINWPLGIHPESL